MKIKKKFIESIYFFFSEKSSNVTFIGLSIMIPIFLLMMTPWLIFISIPIEKRNSGDFQWLENMSWIWPICIFAICFIGLIVRTLYNEYLKK